VESINIKTAITLGLLGITLVLISIPLYLEKIKMNRFYGFRIRKAFESEENWYRINKYAAKAMMCWAVVVMAMALVCLFLAPQHVLTAGNASFLIVLIPIVQTLHYAKRSE
jgi:hypothetical protein